MLLKINTNEGVHYYNSNGRRHRDNDQPAIIFANGSRYWYEDGELHRDNKPAIIRVDGYQAWYKGGKVIDANKWIRPRTCYLK